MPLSDVTETLEVAASQEFKALDREEKRLNEIKSCLSLFVSRLSAFTEKYEAPMRVHDLCKPYYNTLPYGIRPEEVITHGIFNGDIHVIHSEKGIPYVYSDAKGNSLDKLIEMAEEIQRLREEKQKQNRRERNHRHYLKRKG